jgi:hypothetical protein
MAGRCLMDDLCLWCHHLVTEHDELGCGWMEYVGDDAQGRQHYQQGACRCQKTRRWLEEHAS